MTRSPATGPRWPGRAPALTRPQVHNAFDDELIAELTAALEHVGADERHARAGARRRRRIVLGRRRPELDARHGRRQRRREPRGFARPGPPDAHAGRTAQAHHRPRERLRPTAAASAWLPAATSPSPRKARSSGCPKSKLGPGAGGDLALRGRRDRPAPGAPLFRHRRSLRCRPKPCASACCTRWSPPRRWTRPWRRRSALLLKAGPVAAARGQEAGARGHVPMPMACATTTTTPR